MATTRWLDRALALAAFGACALAVSVALARSPGSFSAPSRTGTATLDGSAMSGDGGRDDSGARPDPRSNR